MKIPWAELPVINTFPLFLEVLNSPCPEDPSEQVIDAFEDAFENEDEACELKRFLTHLVAPLQEKWSSVKVPTPSFVEKNIPWVEIEGNLLFFLLQANESHFLFWNFFTPLLMIRC